MTQTSWECDLEPGLKSQIHDEDHKFTTNMCLICDVCLGFVISNRVRNHKLMTMTISRGERKYRCPCRPKNGSSIAQVQQNIVSFRAYTFQLRLIPVPQCQHTNGDRRVYELGFHPKSYIINLKFARLGLPRTLFFAF